MTDKQLNQLYEVVSCVADLPQLLRDLEGVRVPFNIIRKIEYMMKIFPDNLVGRARLLRNEMEKTGFPKQR